MTTTTPNEAFATSSPTTATAGLAIRDPRLDFFRGIAMFIILFAHTPGNAWTSWIPARWGLSHATEIFVFCSCMPSSIASGRSFVLAWWSLGPSRLRYPVWLLC